jgi:hypothetical protein
MRSKAGGHLALDKGVHHALEDFRWMQENISTHPTWIVEIVPLPPVAEGHHDASGLGACGIWFPGPHLAPRTGFTSTQPLVWRYRWPDFISSWLVTADNQHGSIMNSDLELAGGLLHLDALSQCFDIWERTVLSKEDNLSTTFWERRGITSTNSPPAYLLCLFGMHQSFHQYVPRFDYISGPSNPITDSLSCNFNLNWSDQLANIMPFLPQHNGLQIWNPKQASCFHGDFSTAQEAVKSGVSPGCASSAITSWDIWSAFTGDLGLDPFLQAFPDKIPFLQIFAVQVCCRELSASGCVVQA